MAFALLWAGRAGPVQKYLEWKSEFRWVSMLQTGSAVCVLSICIRSDGSLCSSFGSSLKEAPHIENITFAL
jgi:hypothetical protein